MQGREVFLPAFYFYKIKNGKLKHKLGPCLGDCFQMIACIWKSSANVNFAGDMSLNSEYKLK